LRGVFEADLVGEQHQLVVAHLGALAGIAGEHGDLVVAAEQRAIHHELALLRGQQRGEREGKREGEKDAAKHPRSKGGAPRASKPAAGRDGAPAGCGGGRGATARGGVFGRKRAPDLRATAPRAQIGRVKRPPKIVIVEDHVMFREILRKVCEKELKLKVVGESGDGGQAAELVKRLQPDLLLLDLHLPNLDGFGVLDAIADESPDTRFLILSSHCDEYTVFRAERAHVQGFVDKNTNTLAVLKAAIGAVAAGGVWYSPAFQRLRERRLADPLSFDKLLTDRERAVLGLVGEALNDKQIAERLKIAVETVEKHRFNIRRKLDLKDNADIARYAREHGFTLVAPKTGGDVMLP
jgi:two-component system response regulator NreC